MSKLVEDARFFAAQAHDGQVRENKARQPYMVHPEEVAQLVIESGGSDEEIAAAFLHDSVEDTPTTFADIIERFGATVGAIVEGLTDPPEFNGLPVLMRKTRQAERIRHKSNSVKRVKIADQTSNVRAIAVDPPVKWKRQKCVDYVEGARRIAAECRGVSEFLDFQFDEAYQTAIRKRRPR